MNPSSLSAILFLSRKATEAHARFLAKTRGWRWLLWRLTPYARKEHREWTVTLALWVEAIHEHHANRSIYSHAVLNRLAAASRPEERN